MCEKSSTFEGTDLALKRARPPRNYVREMQPILLAFGNRIALTADFVSSRATDASALPTHSRSSWGPHSIHTFFENMAVPPH